jgi:ribA/ribD-fused uncharacterized protein
MSFVVAIIVVSGFTHLLIALMLGLWARWVSKQMGGQSVWWRRAVALPLIGLALSIVATVVSTIFLLGAFDAIHSAPAANKASQLAANVSELLNWNAMLLIPTWGAYGGSMGGCAGEDFLPVQARAFAQEAAVMGQKSIDNRADLIAALARGQSVKYLFFWGHTPRGNELGPWCFSQWWPSPFEVDGVQYPAAEHYMMAEKARLFGDDATCARILETTEPALAKKLGRKVRPFDEPTWEAHRFEIVVRASIAKFGQNPELGNYLSKTGRRVLVEASPRDRVWGIGLAASDPRAEDPSQWRGLNLLGFALMSARDALGG